MTTNSNQEQQILLHLRGVLTTTMQHWDRLVQGLPAVLLQQRPLPAEWSALECLQHMVDTERVFQARLEAFLRSAPQFPAYDPDSQGTRLAARPDPLEIYAGFARQRRTSLEMLGRVSLNDLDRRSRHQELGPVTLREMLNEWAAHDLNHTIQAERAVMQPFLKSCGPWIKYFEEHLMQG